MKYIKILFFLLELQTMKKNRLVNYDTNVQHSHYVAKDMNRPQLKNEYTQTVDGLVGFMAYQLQWVI